MSLEVPHQETPVQFSGSTLDQGPLDYPESLEIPDRALILHTIAREIKVDLYSLEGIEAVRTELAELQKLVGTDAKHGRLMAG